MIKQEPGEVSEWLKELVSKTSVRFPYRGFESRPLRFRRLEREKELSLSNHLPKAIIGVVFRLPDVMIGGDLPPTSNLLLHYKYEGDALDSSA